MTKSIKFSAISCTVFVFSLVGTAKALAAPEGDWSHFYKDGEHALFIGDYQTAQRAYGSALELLKRSGDHSARLKFTLEKLTESFVLDNKLKNAEQFYSQLRELIHTGDHSTRLEQVFRVDLKELATDYERKWNRYHDRQCLEHSVELLEVATGGDDVKSFEETVALSRVYMSEGQVDKGIELLKRAIATSEKKFGKDPNSLPAMLNQVAHDCEKQQQYEAANKLELRTIALAKGGSGIAKTQIPAYFAFLAINSIAQDKNERTVKQYYNQTLSEYKKIKAGKEKASAQQAVACLISVIQQNKQKNSFKKSEMQLRELLSIQRAISSDPRCEYGTYNVMSTMLGISEKGQESEQCLLRAIDIAKLPHSYAETDVPDLYLRLALQRFGVPSRIPDANTAFYEALSAERDKNGFHSGLVLLYWGCKLRESGRYTEASEKLNAALQKGLRLPPEKRGTLVADSLFVLSAIESHLGKVQEKQLLLDRSAAEIKLQKGLKLTQNPGPDFFHRL